MSVVKFTEGQHFVAEIDKSNGTITFREIPAPEKTVTLTRSQIVHAWADAIKKDSMPLPCGTPRLSLFLDEIGFPSG